MASTSITSGSPVIPAAAALYFSLEDAASRGLSHDELAKLLDESADFLCGCLGSYKAPNARSKAEVESGSVQYGGEKRSLNASIREVTIAASKKLNLDEVQTYALLRRCLAEDGSSAPAQPASLDDDLAERLTTYYFRERLSVLKCVHALLMHAQAVDDDRTTELVSTTLERMLEKGLEANLVDGICAHLLGETPARPEDARKNPSVSKDWSELALEETRVMLECVFLMYYDRRTKCSSATFARLARAFERGARRAGAEHARMRTRTRANDAKASERAAPDAARIEWRQKLSIACVMLAVFLHLLGFTVTGPITPGLVRRFGVAAENVGYLTSAYPLGMFGALFFWPQLSDKVGRKPIIVLSLMGVGIGLILQGLCVRSGASFETFLLLRVLSGAFAGASPVVKAYLADASTPEFLPQLMAWREASCTLAFIVGPTLGGVLFAGFSLSAAISVTGWASVAAATLVLLFMTPPQAMKASMLETTK